MSRWRAGTPLNAIAFPGGHRRLLTDLLNALFRHLATIDWCIDQCLRKRKLKAKFRDIIRLGLCSAWYQDGIHESIAVDSCVRLAKKQSGGRMGGLVNAVLREALRRGLPAPQSRDLPMHVRLNLPHDLYQSWATWMPARQLADIATHISHHAPLTVRARTACPQILPEALRSVLVPMDVPDWVGNQRLWICLDPGQFFQDDLFHQGAFYVQDPSTLLAPNLLTIHPGETIGDFCSAPGGKTVILAEKLPDNACLIAADRSRKRLQKISDNLAGTSPSPRLLVADATAPPFHPATFDGVLLDVPCSNTGVLRRRPDARWRFSTANLQAIVRLQKDILTASADCVKPGGRLVYSTCSIEPAENQKQIQTFLDTHPGWALETELQLFPDEHWDGAYAALLVKKK